jgi:hypothetical protein
MRDGEGAPRWAASVTSPRFVTRKASARMLFGASKPDGSLRKSPRRLAGARAWLACAHPLNRGLERPPSGIWLTKATFEAHDRASA